MAMMQGAARISTAVLVLLVCALPCANAYSGCTKGGIDGYPFVHGQDMSGCAATLTITGGNAIGVGTLSPAGDINGDGTEDFAISNTDTSTVYVIFGKDEESHPASYTVDLGAGEGFLIFGEAGENFGAAIAGGFDINSDGFDDIVIGSPDYDGAAGRAFIVFGQDLFPTDVNVSAPSNQVVQIVNSEQRDLPPCSGVQCPWYNQTAFGLTIASVGDVNDDGLHDVLVGSYGGDVGAVLVLGRSLGTSWPNVLDLKECDGETNCARLVISYGKDNPDLGHGFGSAVTGNVDYNNDGLKDMMIGAPSAFIGAENHNGLVAVFYGSDVKYEALTDMRTLDGTTGQVIFGLFANGLFGATLEALDDINGDGIGDLAVSAPGGSLLNALASTPAHVYLFFGFQFDKFDENPRVGEDQDAAGFTNPLTPTDMFRMPHTANAKCVDSDLESHVDCSAGFIIQGPTMTVSEIANNPTTSPWFGSSLTSGDLNNDGLSDLIINTQPHLSVSPDASGVGFATQSADAWIIYGQTSSDGFEEVNSIGNLGNMQSGAGLCGGVKSRLLTSTTVDLSAFQCGMMTLDSTNEYDEVKVAKVSTAPGAPLRKIGDVNKDSLADIGYLDSDNAVMRLIPGRCNDHDTDCWRESNLPPGCKVDLGRLMVGFINDDFLEWGRGYIRYVMEQMEPTVRDAWDQNMLAKGFYVNMTETLRCWCSPPDQRGGDQGSGDQTDTTWQWHCFEYKTENAELVCSDPLTAETQADDQSGMQRPKTGTAPLYEATP